MSRQQLNQLSSIFGWSFLVCAALQLFALGMYLLLREFAYYPLHSLFPSLLPADVDRSAYEFLNLMKVLGLTFLLSPWLGLKIVAARTKQ